MGAPTNAQTKTKDVRNIFKLLYIKGLRKMAESFHAILNASGVFVNLFEELLCQTVLYCRLPSILSILCFAWQEFIRNKRKMRFLPYIIIVAIVLLTTPLLWLAIQSMNSDEQRDFAAVGGAGIDSGARIEIEVLRQQV